jgi:DNA-directed RNA polymerase subunit omega
MLTEVLRQAMDRVNNRFHLAVLAAERASQLLHGARPAVDNPQRERVMKVALREIAEEKLKQEEDRWVVDRPPMALEQVFNLAEAGVAAEAGLEAAAASPEAQTEADATNEEEE